MQGRHAIVIALLLAFLSLYPQFTLIQTRGDEYNGAVFVNDNDESVYIAYLQALIDGRPRQANIYSGGEDEPKETFLSIQAFPAYVLAFPARLLGLDSQDLFPILSVIFSFAVALSFYWFFYIITEDSAFSAIAAFFVLVLGASAAGYGAVKYFSGLGSASSALPFLRRYTPGLSFSFLFIFAGSLWIAIKNENGPTVRNGLLAIASFLVLLYSYFFLWTTALAWALMFMLLAVALPRRTGLSSLRKFWTAVGAVCFAASIPYFWLLSQRISSTDSSQLLESTRLPVFVRPPIWIGTGVLVALTVLYFSGKVKIQRRDAIMIASCALLPVAVFNQHVLTGYSLQPFHYNLYTAPYFSLIAVALLIWVCFKRYLAALSPWFWAGLIALMTVWGIAEAHLTAGYRLSANVSRDAAMPIGRRLRELAANDLRTAASQVTFNSDLFQADHQPSMSPQGVLWCEHLPWAASITEAAARRRYFAHLYYMNRDEDWLRTALRDCPRSFECKAVFGARVIPTLAINSHFPDASEIADAVAEFAEFIRTTDQTGPSETLPSYAVIRGDNTGQFDFSNIDKWFERHESETLGIYTLYRLSPRGPIGRN